MPRGTWNTVWIIVTTVLLSAGKNTAPAQTNADYSSFGKFIAERNIFNPNRYARSVNNYRPRTTRTVRRNSFSLAGIMSYGDGETPGTYAFFDGTSSDFRKTLQRDGTIANFKVTAIHHDSVTLQQDTNEIVLKVGMAMREESAGHWAVSESAATFARSTFADESSRGSWSGRRNSGGRSTFGAVSTSAATTTENTDTNTPDAGPPDMAGPGGPPPDEMGPPPDEGGGPPETNAAENTAPPTGPGSDVLMRLMQQRQQEESGNQPRN